ncbi:hypothetical protein NDU88_004338, partial [Pleurodeles waltl]
RRGGQRRKEGGVRPAVQQVPADKWPPRQRRPCSPPSPRGEPAEPLTAPGPCTPKDPPSTGVSVPPGGGQ